jgi:hypothetical protein
MKNLWVFGDSFTYGNGSLLGDPYEKKYRVSDDEKIWPVIVSEELGMNLKNKGFGLYSNDKIIDTIIENYDYISEGDLVILGKTFYSRFDIPINNHLITLSPTNLPPHEDEFLNELIICMNSKLFEDRQMKRFTFFKNQLEKRGIFFLTWDVETEWYSYETIKSVTNGEIIDLHWSYKGHNDFSKRILSGLEELKGFNNEN